MKFSIFMMPLHHPTENPSLAFDRDISLIHYAEELGYDEFFIGEHHSGGWETMPAPEMALAKASAHAHRIRLGTSVISVPFHHPFHVAERMAFLDHLTKAARFSASAPAPLVTDKDLFGLLTEKLYPMMAESVDIIVRLLESPEPIDYDGQYWKIPTNALAAAFLPTAAHAARDRVVGESDQPRTGRQVRHAVSVAGGEECEEQSNQGRTME